jgi:hypothetical protein
MRVAWKYPNDHPASDLQMAADRSSSDSVCGSLVSSIAAMRELGIDISGHRSKSVDEFNGQQFDYVLTVCDNAKESCPIFPGQTVTVHHNFEDPTLKTPRMIRKLICE